MPHDLKKIDRVLSLGAWCQTQHQIRRKFGDIWSSPYDWLVTPLRALQASLEDKGERFGASCSAWDNGTDVRCNEYGLLYHHEFERNADATIRFDVKVISDCRNKLGHKMGSFVRNVGAGGSMLVRFGGFAEDPRAWPYRHDSETVQSSDLNRLCAAIKQTSGCNDFVLAFVYHREYTRFQINDDLDERILTFAFERVGLDEVPVDGWKGNDKNWDQFFDKCASLFQMPSYLTEQA